MNHHYKKCSTLSELTEWLDKMNETIEVVSIFSQTECVRKYPTTITHDEYVIIYRYKMKKVTCDINHFDTKLAEC